MPENVEESGYEFSLRDVVDTMRRRKWVVVQSFAFLTVIGVVTAALSPPIYGTTAKLIVETPSNVLTEQKYDTSNPLGVLSAMRQKQSVETQLAILRSAEFRRRMTKKLRPHEGSVPVVLTYSPVEKTSIINISAESTNPVAAAAWANMAAQQYTELTKQSNREAITETKSYLETQVTEASRKLQIAERKLLHFKEKTALTEGGEAQALQVKDSMELETKAREARNELISLQARIKGIEARLSREPEMKKEVKILPNPDLEAVRSQIVKIKGERAVALADFNPESEKIKAYDDRIANLEQVIAGMPTTVREERETPNPVIETLRAQLEEARISQEAYSQLAAQLGQTASSKSVRVSRIAPWEVEMSQISRERELAEKTYLDYSEKLRDLNVRERVLGASASLMEPAPVPGSPIRPNKAQQIALAMVMGLMLGVGFAFLQEFLDDRVNTTEDIERLTALPTLGVVPTIGDEDNRLLIGKDALSPVTESYRALRTSVQYSAIDRPMHSLIVTSGHPGEGKSVTSANLAIAMALQGKRVILIDADLRRPNVHRLFRFEPEPGLSSVLAGEITLEEAMRDTAIEGLKVLPAGPLPPNPPELLNSQAMMDLLAELHEKADLIVFDTPPVIPVTDAQVLAGHVDGVVLVVEAGQARKAAVKHARDLLSQTRARVLGVVLNKIDQSSKGFYYHYYYRAGYGKYGQKAGYGYGQSQGYGYGPAYGPGYGYGRAGRKLGADADDAALPAGEELEAETAPLAQRLKDWE